MNRYCINPKRAGTCQLGMYPKTSAYTNTPSPKTHTHRRKLDFQTRLNEKLGKKSVS